MLKPILLTKVIELKKYTKGVPQDAVILIAAISCGLTHYLYKINLPDEVLASIVVAAVAAIRMLRLFKRKRKGKRPSRKRILSLSEEIALKDREIEREYYKDKGEIRPGKMVVVNRDGRVSEAGPSRVALASEVFPDEDGNLPKEGGPYVSGIDGRWFKLADVGKSVEHKAGSAFVVLGKGEKDG